jgi:hypothetical protein
MIDEAIWIAGGLLVVQRKDDRVECMIDGCISGESLLYKTAKKTSSIYKPQ